MAEIREQSLEQMRAALQESRCTMHLAMEAAGIFYFEYFPAGDYALEHDGKEQLGLDARMENYPDSWFAKKITHPDDEATLRAAFATMKQGGASAGCTVRNRVGGVYRWHRYSFTAVPGTQGRHARVVCTAVDVTPEQEAKKLNAELETLYARTPGWIFTCKNDAGWTLMHTNDRILDATGYTAAAFAAEMQGEIARIIPQAQAAALRKKAAALVAHGFGAADSQETPIRHRDGSLTWLNMNLYWDRNGDDGVLYVCCSDITALKRQQQELQENNAMYALTTRQAHMSLWSYDITNDTLYNTGDSATKHPGDAVVHHFSSAAISRGYIHPDSQAEFRRMIDELRCGAESVCADIWLQRKSGEGWWCERITWVSLAAESGCPRRAFGLGRDVTDFKEAERRLGEVKNYQDAAESEKLLMKARCNVTTDQVESLHTKTEMRVAAPSATYSGGVQQMADRAYSDQEKALVLEMLSRQKLEEALKGSGEYSFEYRRRDSRGRADWVRVAVRTLLDPASGALIVFVNVLDINQEKKLSTIINRLAQLDYETLMLIYTESDEVEQIRAVSSDEMLRVGETNGYSAVIQKFVTENIEPERQQEALQSFSIERIRQRLDADGVYRLSFALQGRRRAHKTWEFTYFDDTHSTIIYTRTDVTALFEEQENQRIALKDALLQAEEASKAKTNFLSRMSHEIRTPMNAIIGMNALAVQVLDQPEQVRDCLSKVGISARFLLSLINDILDMNRIESGKVTLKNARFPLEELTASINSIIYEQAVQKGLDYDCVLSSFTADYYVGDAMKLQQVLVNLLGNSVKFTPSGGKVQLIIRQERVENGTAHMLFSVNDTGMGISPALQKRMFDPFEQGDTTLTTPYKGTGLGLAIAKNLVTMMGGSIAVNSIEGVGSEFTVRVPLGCCETDAHYRPLELDMPLEKMKTLIVDDDVLICEQTKRLLLGMGMKAEWVESGRKAVEEIRRKWERHDYFDVVLLDWKMPEMDGIETAREIRTIVGDEVTIIVMTAYDWTEIEQAARQAGVNLLVAKPLFRSTLISAFERAFQTKQHDHRKKEIESYDFTGQRILLVEDHILNVEVARRLLESRHATVEVAENGLRALEMFMEAGENYYQAILMDIRMPVMDGLTATRSIRQLHRAGARTIPIIAMSANAFDEDVEKSRAAGMNEHLSKPIEPQILFEALHKWLNREQQAHPMAEQE